METKMNTFLTLCKTMNYRLTAEQLHLTQPAVTRQIQALEHEYGCKLFQYDGHRLSKTPQAELLEEYGQSLRVNEEELKASLLKKSKRTLRIGATRTIGDYVITSAVATYLEDPDHELHLTIDNTEKLLQMLEDHQIDFALIEGVFDKKRYDFELLRNETFSGICDRTHHFAGNVVKVNELENETLVVREEGSGTRRFLEQDLMKQGYDLSIFSRVVTINSFILLKEMIKQKKGISFSYHAVIEDEPELATFKVEGFLQEHEFNLVYLKNTNMKKYGQEFLNWPR